MHRKSSSKDLREKDHHVLKINEQVCFFPNKQGMGHLTWLTGTVNQIFDCGHSYMIIGPNGRVYRRNRAHLKPIFYDGSSSQNCTTAKKDEQPKADSFQDPKARKKVKTMSFQTDTADVTARAMIFDEPNNNHPSHLSSHQLYSQRSPTCSPLSSFPSRESSVVSDAEAATPKDRVRHKSEPAFIRPKMSTGDQQQDFQHYCKKPHH